MSTCHPGTDLDTVLSAFPQATCQTAPEVACNDDAVGAPIECDLGGNNRKSIATFAATSGEDYVFRVSGFDNVSGNYEIDVSCSP